MQTQTELPRRVDGFPIRPRLDYIFVADFGQPDCTPGGIFIGDDAKQFWRYRFDLWRFGEVVAIGPGRPREEPGEDGTLPRVLIPMPEISIGDTVMFSRKHGTRLGDGWTFEIPKYNRPLLLRVLDPEKCVAVLPGFDPWWNVEQSQLNPDGMMTG